MFSTILQEDFLNNVQEQSKVEIEKDRSKYNVVWNIISEYCKGKELIISDPHILIDEPSTLQHIYNAGYKIYTSNPFRHANNITNLIHQGTKDSKTSYTTKLKTIREREEFIIEYDTRIVAIIYQLQKHRSIELQTIINPVKNNNLLYMPAEIELIDIYHKMYDPSQASTLEEANRFEDKLYQQIIKRKEEGILGADDNKHRHLLNCKEKKKEFLEAIKISLVKDWLPRKQNTILIGSWAYDWIKLGNNICADIEKIQIISEMKPEEMLNDLQKYISEIIKTTITMKEQELHIPKDFRTNRYTYYMQIVTEKGITEKPFLDLFNCANFEVVPYSVVDGVFIGSKYTILRFLLIDLWIVKLIKKLGLLTQDILTKKIEYIWKLIDFFRNAYTESIDYNYLGIYRDYSIDKKITNIQGKAFYPYFPELYKREHNTYRNI